MNLDIDKLFRIIEWFLVYPLLLMCIGGVIKNIVKIAQINESSKGSNIGGLDIVAHVLFLLGWSIFLYAILRQTPNILRLLYCVTKDICLPLQ
jgi:hypothetical protein